MVSPGVPDLPEHSGQPGSTLARFRHFGSRGRGREAGSRLGTPASEVFSALNVLFWVLTCKLPLLGLSSGDCRH